MTPRKSPPCGGPSPISAAKRDQSHHTSTLRARSRALAFNATALAAGRLPADSKCLGALALQAHVVAWDVELDQALAVMS